MLGGGIGTVILVVLYLLLGGDPQALFNSAASAITAICAVRQSSAAR